MKNDVRKSILKKLLYNDKMKYNELWGKEFTSSLFDYHLKKLLEEGLVEKQDETYGLTPKGMQFVTSLDGETIEQKPRPIVCSFVLGIDNEGKLLVHRRKKQPFMNYVGIPGGKLELGERIPEQAAREFLEETGLEAKKMTLKIITNYITYDNDNVAHQIVGFFFLAEQLSGELILNNREGENFFIAKSETKDLLKYPDFDWFVKELLLPRDYPIFQEAKRYIKDGEFTGIEFLE